MERERMVCINNSKQILNPCEIGAIYRVKEKIFNDGSYNAKLGLWLIFEEIPDMVYYHVDFRPICDDGYILCDYLENVDFKQYQLEEAIKQ